MNQLGAQGQAAAGAALAQGQGMANIFGGVGGALGTLGGLGAMGRGPLAGGGGGAAPAGGGLGADAANAYNGMSEYQRRLAFGGG